MPTYGPFDINAASEVTAPAVIADNVIVRGDGGAKAVQGSAITVSDVASTNVSMTTTTGNSLTLATLDGNKDIIFTPHGTGRTNATTLLKVGTTADPFESEALSAMLITRTITGATAGRGFRDSTVTAATGGHNSYDAYPTINTASTTVDHVADYQARGSVIGVAGTLTNWYGNFSKLNVDAGATVTALRNFYCEDRSGAGTVDVQIGFNVASLESATHNYYLGLSGSATPATQAKQSSFHHPKIHFGASTNGSDNYQVEINPSAGNVSGRTALSISGLIKTGANLPTINISETWNNGSNAYAMIYGRIGDTNSAATSTFIDVGTVAGGSLFSVDKAGNVLASRGSLATGGYAFNSDPNTGMYSTGADAVSLKIGGVQMLQCSGAGILWENSSPIGTISSDTTALIQPWNFSTTLAAVRTCYGTFSGANAHSVFRINPTNTSTSLQQNSLTVETTYNQASGTAANTDVLIKRTETALGSGTQLFVDFQVGSTSQLNVSNTGVVTVCAATATPAAGSTSARLLFGTTAGFGIYYGSGAPTVSAAQGSLYLRSDGSGTTSRIYVNNSAGSGTTWTALTSAA